MPIVATCGHTLVETDGPDGMGHTVTTRAWSSEFTRAVRVSTVCQACCLKMHALGVVVDEASAQAWLHQDTPDNLPTW